MCQCVVWTHNDFPFLSVHCPCNTQGESTVPITECPDCQCGAGTKSRLELHCCECNKRERVQEEKCGLCGVVIFTTRCGVRLWSITRGTPTFWSRSNRGFILSIPYDLSHHELVHQPSHQDEDDEDGFAFGSSSLRFAMATLCCSRSLTILTAY